jgi:ABC-type transport system involved in cytochrome bd biosynthesis fused ATPase/permease subunit
MVGDICNGIAGDISLDNMRSNVEWQGPAAEAYKAQVPPQGEALMAVKDIANSIDSFWLAIKFAFAGFVIAIVGAIAAACTIVGIPAAIGVVVAAAAAAIGLITAAVLALESHVNAIENEQTAIRQKVKDLADGQPMTDTASIADASTHDGDPADWRPNR